MASRSALCVLGVERLISSARITEWKMGPLLNSNAPALALKTETPRTTRAMLDSMRDAAEGMATLFQNVLSAREPVKRVDGGAVQIEAEMQVGGVRQSGGSQGADDVGFFDELALAHCDFGQVQVSA